MSAAPMLSSSAVPATSSTPSLVTSPIGSYPFPSYPTSPSLSPLSYSGHPYPDYRRRSLAYPYPYPAIVGSDWYTNELATNPKLRPKYVSRYSPSLLLVVGVVDTVGLVTRLGVEDVAGTAELESIGAADMLG